MDKIKLNEFYNMCKQISSDKLSDLLQLDISDEEKEFYVSIYNYFLQIRQKKIIESDFEA